MAQIHEMGVQNVTVRICSDLPLTTHVIRSLIHATAFDLERKRNFLNIVDKTFRLQGVNRLLSLHVTHCTMLQLAYNRVAHRSTAYILA